MGVPELVKIEGKTEVTEVPSRINGDISKRKSASLRSTVEMKQTIISTVDMEVKQRFVEMLHFRTSSHPTSTLRDYVGRMANGQKDIYYMIGRSAQQLSRSSFVKRVVQAGLEVIYMTDPIMDNQLVKSLNHQYDHLHLVSVYSECLELPPLNQFDRKRRHRKALDEFLPLCKRLKSVYPKDIQKIVISNTLVENSCAMVPCDDQFDDADADEPSFDINLESGRIRFEINPDNDSLRLLCIQARVLERKQQELDDLVKLIFGPPSSEDSISLEELFPANSQ